MARYRHKDEGDLVWNRIRRKLTRDLDTEIQNRREVVLNDLLGGAWDKYAKALQSGKLLELEDEYNGLIDTILSKHMAALPSTIEDEDEVEDQEAA